MMRGAPDRPSRKARSASATIEPSNGRPIRRSRERCATTPASPNDADIRAVLVSSLRSTHADEPGATIIEELGLCKGRVRIDVAVVNGSLHGYEIKSDRDTLRRLVTQADLYSRVLDRATLVVGPRNAAEAVAALPSWWEVVVAEVTDGVINLRKRRTGRPNPARDARSLVELLWRQDALALLGARGCLRGYRSRPRREVWDYLCCLYTVDEIAEAVRSQLKARVAAQALRPLE